MISKAARILVLQYRLLFALAILLGLVCLPMSRQLKLDWNVESMFPEGDPVVTAYRELQSRFGGNDICLAVYEDAGLWAEDGSGLERLEGISAALSEVEGVQAVLSLAELHRILQRLRGPMQLFNFKEQKSALLDPDNKLAQAFAKVFEGYTHHPDSTYVAIACLLKPDTVQRGPLSHEQTLARLQQIMQGLEEPARSGFITGEPILVAEGFKMVERDGWRLGITSSLLVSVVLLVCFRSLRWTLIPLCVVHWSLLLTQATLVVFDLNLTMISSTLTAIVTVIGVATSMHLMLRYQEQRRKGTDRIAAMQASFEALLVPVFWACVTDAVGFCALMTASVGPVRDFGLMMAIGSMCVFVAIVLLVPGLALLGRGDTDPRTPRLDDWVRRSLIWVFQVSLRYRSIGVGCVVALLVVAIAGSLRLQVETDFTKNFQADSPLVRGYATIESELGGAGVWDLMIPVPASISQAYVDKVIELENRLRAIEVESGDEPLRLTKVLSIADAVKAAETLPVFAALPAGARISGMRTSMPDFTGALFTKEPDADGIRWLRMMLRSRERAPAARKSELVRRVEEELQHFTAQKEWLGFFESKAPESKLAGYHVMLSRLVDSVLADQWRCFAVASLGIYVVMLIATRSWLLALATFVPNALPILLVLGTMSWTGVKANMGVAMIAAVSLGLSIDSSIHYLLHYRRQLRKGLDAMSALRSAQENVGLAAVLATVALIAGFVSLSISEFVPTAVFGTLASLTMLGSLLGNLVILPMLIAPRKSAAELPER
ncbi:MAG: RND family transporter [Pirellulaceae bacterium]